MGLVSACSVCRGVLQLKTCRFSSFPALSYFSFFKPLSSVLREAELSNYILYIIFYTLKFLYIYWNMPASPRPFPIPIPGVIPRLQTSAKMYSNNPGKLAMLSHRKLEEEYSTEEPDLRRCVGHNAVLSNSMSVARDRQKRSSHFTESNDIDTTYRCTPNEDCNTEVSTFRGRVVAAVKSIMQRGSPATTTTITTTTGNGTTTTTKDSPRKGHGLVRVKTHEVPENRETTRPEVRQSSIAFRARLCVSLLSSARRSWDLSRTSIG